MGTLCHRIEMLKKSAGPLLVGFSLLPGGILIACTDSFDNSLNSIFIFKNASKTRCMLAIVTTEAKFHGDLVSPLSPLSVKYCDGFYLLIETLHCQQMK
jgi:hypothetical protein